MSYNNNRQTVESSKTADYCRIFRESLIAMKLDEVLEQTLDEIKCVRPLCMPGE
jgi:hypothetical protein